METIIVENFLMVLKKEKDCISIIMEMSIEGLGPMIRNKAWEITLIRAVETIIREYFKMVRKMDTENICILMGMYM